MVRSVCKYVIMLSDMQGRYSYMLNVIYIEYQIINLQVMTCI